MFRTGWFTATAVVAAIVLTGGVAQAGDVRHRYDRAQLQRDLDAIHDTGVSGVLAEVTIGSRRLRGTAGVADLDAGGPVAADGYFRMGSNTKTFVAVVVLQLVAEGRLSLDDPVGRWLPGVVAGNGNDGSAVTVRHLLQHTSGLHNYTDDLLAGLVIGKVTGHDWAHEVRDRVVRPLGLRDTYAPGDGTDLPDPHAGAYLYFDRDTPIETADAGVTWGDAAGALVTTASDLSRFWAAIGRGRLLRPAQAKQMRTTVAGSTFEDERPGGRYGLGIEWAPLSCGGAYWSHAGDMPGFSTRTGVSADGRKTVVISTSTSAESPVDRAAFAMIDHALCSRG